VAGEACCWQNHVAFDDACCPPAPNACQVYANMDGICILGEKSCCDKNSCTIDDCDTCSGDCVHLDRYDCCSNATCAALYPGQCEDPSSISPLCCETNDDCLGIHGLRNNTCTVFACQDNVCVTLQDYDPTCCGLDADCDDTDSCTLDLCVGVVDEETTNLLYSVCQNTPEALEDCCRNDDEIQGLEQCCHPCVHCTCEIDNQTGRGVVVVNNVSNCCETTADCAGSNDACTEYTCCAPGSCNQTQITQGLLRTCVARELHDNCCLYPTENRTTNRQSWECEDGSGCTVDVCHSSSSSGQGGGAYGECFHYALDGCCYNDTDCGVTTACSDHFCCLNTSLGCPRRIDAQGRDFGQCSVHHDTTDNCCAADADCSDNNQCTTDTCVEGTCVFRARADLEEGQGCVLTTCNPETGELSQLGIQCDPVDYATQCDTEIACRVENGGCASSGKFGDCCAENPTICDSLIGQDQCTQFECRTDTSVGYKRCLARTAPIAVDGIYPCPYGVQGAELCCPNSSFAAAYCMVSGVCGYTSDYDCCLRDADCNVNYQTTGCAKCVFPLNNLTNLPEAIGQCIDDTCDGMQKIARNQFFAAKRAALQGLTVPSVSARMVQLAEKPTDAMLHKSPKTRAHQKAQLHARAQKAPHTAGLHPSSSSTAVTKHKPIDRHPPPPSATAAPPPPPPSKPRVVRRH